MSKTIVSYTRAPRQWHGLDLFDWGTKGLRVRGNQSIATFGRPRKTFDIRWTMDFCVDVKPGDAQLTKWLKAQSKEIWPVYKRKGAYWKVDRYIVPRKLVEASKLRNANEPEILIPDDYAGLMSPVLPIPSWADNETPEVNAAPPVQFLVDEDAPF